MQTTIRFLDDLAKIGASFLGLALGVKNEVKAKLQAKKVHLVRDMDFVSRVEFEVVRSMAQKARQEFEEIKKKVNNLEHSTRHCDEQKRVAWWGRGNPGK